MPCRGWSGGLFRARRHQSRRCRFSSKAAVVTAGRVRAGSFRTRSWLASRRVGATGYASGCCRIVMSCPCSMRKSAPTTSASRRRSVWRPTSASRACRTALIQRFLPPAPATVLDVAAARRVSLWLAERGYEVTWSTPCRCTWSRPSPRRRTRAARWRARPSATPPLDHADHGVDALFMLGRSIPHRGGGAGMCARRGAPRAASCGTDARGRDHSLRACFGRSPSRLARRAGVRGDRRA